MWPTWPVLGVYSADATPLQGTYRMRNTAAMKIYLAGPLFSDAERNFLDVVAARLRAEGFEVFVPHEQFAEQKFQRSDGDSTADEVYSVDLAGVMGANAVLAWLDGTQVDDGTSVEIGIFSRLAAQDPARYKGIIGLSTDMRVARRKGLVPADGINLFVVGAIRASGEVVWSIDEAVAALIRLRDRP